MATIADVAREAGVARSTVSAVLTGRKYVSPEIRLRVDAAIKDLNFVVNARARALATNRTMTIGLVVHFHEAEFAPALAAYLVAVSEAAKKANYRIMLLTAQDSVSEIREAIAERVVDGLVLMNVVEEDPRLEPIRAEGFPAVVIGMPEDTSFMDAVDLDFADAARQIVEAVAAQGETRIALLGWPDAVYQTRSTYAQSFRSSAIATAEKLGLELLVHCMSVNPSVVRVELTEFLRSDDVPAIIIHNDAAAAMLPLVLHEFPGRNPYVVSLHSAELSKTFQVPFDSVESKPEEVSSRAIRMLVARLENRDLPFGRELIKPSGLKVRAI